MEQEKINRLQWILDDAVARGEIPGAILMVRREGKETVYLESGYADIEAKKPVARDSIYRLYSMSKPITATAVMILVAPHAVSPMANAAAREIPHNFFFMTLAPLVYSVHPFIRRAFLI